MIDIKNLGLEDLQVNGSRRGRVRVARSTAPSGRYVRAEPIGEQTGNYDIALDATLRAALLRQPSRQEEEWVWSISTEDIRKKVYKRPLKTLIVFVVDSSDSMGDTTTQARIKAAKGAMLAILVKAYQKRHRVGLVCFRGETAEVVLQPTSSITRAERSLRSIPTGGSTPFADGLMLAWKLVRTERRKDPHLRPLLVVFSDGEANVPYDPELRLSGVMKELLTIGERIGRDNIASLVIDTRPLRDPSPVMSNLADALGGGYHHISRLKTSGVVKAVVDF